ncbi:transcriptional regulator family: C2H2 zinc finger [Penicillium maclennaniae]|uniref:transcriptional regulator family: C2H2 zinc finger n=1 Tax=Penicillium maclennaniae TaxID=1343394 RepID=UPI00253F6EDF|nr:transcriptional regulator family: C2H2 zinc finger [Penicillium maclennaniae]KAJ5678474.1 transcriptional regulator family: C2H2 zinc finger [Penicillium maclennaniae]
MTADNYDSDDAMNRSPPPRPQTVKYREEEPLPPFVSGDDVASAKGTPNRSRKPHLPESQTQTRLGDSVLISYLAPDLQMQTQTDLKANVIRQYHHYLHPSHHRANLSPPPPRPVITTTSVSPREYPRLPSIQAPDRRPSEDRPGLSPLNDIKPSPEKNFSLPSLQSLQSPPSSCAAPSPDSGSSNSRVLPPIRSALDGLSPNEFPQARGLPPLYSYPGSASSRNDSPHDRQLPQFLPQQVPPSPFSHLSPVSTKDVSNNPSPASTAPFWRGPPPPPPSDSTHTATPYDMSPMTAKSPATGYPTPTEQVGPTPGSVDRASFSSQQSVNGVHATGSYKCTHPGCTAAPFQTQYLLNSHANVHSQDRPHFCPVEGCPRGVGGKGFKRKNEMMRHGLVHNSPGYVCPFCPDQQHKYPRPDNLQRHVRVHHVDKNKDDPILREVLAQRPVGSSRGRRRRINS